MNVKYIVEQTGLGRLQLDGRSQNTANIFMNMNRLQKILGVGNEINSILVSNNGNKFSGIKNDEQVTKIIERCLDDLMGYSDLGYQLNTTGSQYLRLTHDDVFFDTEIFDLLTNENTINDNPDTTLSISPVLTYFVNSITSVRTNKSIN